MSEKIKIVVIGAGSANFSLVTLADILRSTELQNASLFMVDINEESLSVIFQLALLLKKYYNSQIDLYKTTNRKEVLENADFVILVIAENMESTWETDFKIAKSYDIWHYAENGGPGAFGHTARNITLCVPIFQDIHDLAPKSWLINFTNPLPRIHYAAETFFNLNCISFCHQYWHGHYIIGKILANDLGINYDDSYQKIRDKALKEYEITAAGLNHFTWAVNFQRRINSENMYPLLLEKIDKVPTNFERLTRDVFKTFGLFPLPGETHLSEYLPFTSKKDQWDHYNLYSYNFEEGMKNRKKDWGKIRAVISGKISPNIFQPEQSERIANIVIALISDEKIKEPAINIRNNGTIRNLPDDAIVEVPCKISKKGVFRENIANFPEAISALCSREISIAKIMTEASIKGDKELAVRAFSIDPMVKDLTLAEKLVEAYITSFSTELPQFR
ncbi:MAG: family 4 glycosyl hydrolase [Candidatus Hodarchaeales archaeon]|jgi:alpha-galactosidase